MNMKEQVSLTLALSYSYLNKYYSKVVDLKNSWLNEKNTENKSKQINDF